MFNTLVGRFGGFAGIGGLSQFEILSPAPLAEIVDISATRQFATNGNNPQIYVVRSGDSGLVQVDAWGGGGQFFPASNPPGQSPGIVAGGGGGYVQGDVSLQSDQLYKILAAGRHGRMSGIFLMAPTSPYTDLSPTLDTALLIAAGGGSAGPPSQNSKNDDYGGGGGYPAGDNGGRSNSGFGGVVAQGGTQVAGGAGGIRNAGHGSPSAQANPGVQYRGGNQNPAAGTPKEISGGGGGTDGAGGDGWYGGGQGSPRVGHPSQSRGGGGGGSSYYNASYVTNFSHESGTTSKDGGEGGGQPSPLWSSYGNQGNPGAFFIKSI